MTNVLNVAHDTSRARAPVADVRSHAARLGARRWWAHQDSNLEQAGYEPAALTVELWAREHTEIDD